ncbi:Eukaryotic-type carbonic anhydrase [Nitzschia inconspicua]|uniref:Eukaryotic-type carbonic anhydrase n=1 Tax=Nitzschia inconspicua TaxID=303405 RepID=A0A9K3Q5A0_9STRA|nr:Eukaryotic-type carbonic anhydrase [Nitzschia inconspicua]
MIIRTFTLLVLSCSAFVTADRFNFRSTSGNDYGPEDWNRVQCDNLETCEGWPDKHLGSIGWKLEKNMCVSCPLTGNNCPAQHRMSPIDLPRDRAIQGHPNWHECPDWHWMNFEDGTCRWDDMEGQFKISPHALQIHFPMRSNGDIDCADATGRRKYPRLDYSKGFPDWWHLDRTDIKVPSEHTQHGKRYAAEVSLAHFYELDHWKNQIGYVSLFLQDYPDERPWHYLDKLICQFRREEEKQRAACGLPPAPVYKMCELYRGQVRTPEDLEFFERSDATASPGRGGQLNAPPKLPIEDFGENPDAKLFPLQMCQGDCDFSEDCAPGLICMRRDPFQDVPGCIGGADYPADTDFCVFDPFGPGYFPPTDVPAVSPTLSPRPTIEQLPPKPVVDFGGTPPLDKFPLQHCQGDCDTDDDCMDGLVCFQRDANEAVPGCLGGEQLGEVTDFCVLDPFGSGYVDPTTEAPSASLTPPTSVPTSRPVDLVSDGEPTLSPSSATRPVGPPKQVLNRGWELNFKLGECEGDCDEDSDCLPGLICFQREAARVSVPGCDGGDEDESLTDYCAYPELPENGATGDLDDDVDSRLETEVPTTVPLPSRAPTAAPTKNAVPLNPIGWSPPADKMPLGLCEGDCDDDSECGDGLVCFQRFLPFTAVPGCLGGATDISLMDYCITDPTLMTTSNSTDSPTPITSTDSPIESNPTASPSLDISVSDNETTAVDILDDVIVGRTDPPPVDCQAYKNLGVNMNRICKLDQFACCQVPRSSSNYCHEVYNILGGDVESACHHCCMEEARGKPLEVGPPNEPHPDGLAPYEHCDKLGNTARVCKDQSCCDPAFANTAYCRNEWAKHKGDVERICWSCCFPSKVFKEETPRRQLLGNNTSGERDVVGPPYLQEELIGTLEERIDFTTSEVEDKDLRPIHTALTEEEMRLYHKNNPPELRPGDKLMDHPEFTQKLIIREENFSPKGEKDEEAYFEELHSAFQRRELQIPIQENYEDVYWWPYEWLLKVGTEYYFRYEGSMTVPPCYTVNHWRVMKDPVRVAKHQITELERLLAWRLNDKCEASTAGRPREGNPDAVDVNRPLQEIKRGHRLVFCECQNWPSKFPKEREWCNRWQQRDPQLRLFENPYNWVQNGF